MTKLVQGASVRLQVYYEVFLRILYGCYSSTAGAYIYIYIYICPRVWVGFLPDLRAEDLLKFLLSELWCFKLRWDVCFFGAGGLASWTLVDIKTMLKEIASNGCGQS